MILNEHQLKELIAEYAIPIPQGRVAYSPQAALSVAKDLGGSLWVVNAQVHASGRNEANGVKVVEDLEAVRAADVPMLGSTLAAYQTGAESLPVHQVYVKVGAKITREPYRGSVGNRASARLAFVMSAAGGMEIGELAQHTPEKIFRINVNPISALPEFQCRQAAQMRGRR